MHYRQAAFPSLTRAAGAILLAGTAMCIAAAAPGPEGAAAGLSEGRQFTGVSWAGYAEVPP